MAAESAGGGFRLAPAAEVQSDLLNRRFISSIGSILFFHSREWFTGLVRF